MRNNLNIKYLLAAFVLASCLMSACKKKAMVLFPPTW